MAQPAQSIPEMSTPEQSSSDKPRVRRVVCGWNEEKNTFLYRDELTTPPPLVSDGPERHSKRSKTASVKAKLSKGEDVHVSPAKSKDAKVAEKRVGRMENRKRKRAAAKMKKNLQQPSPRSTPTSETGHQTRMMQALGVESESSDSDDDSSDESPTLDEPVYVVPDHLQGTIFPVPRPVNSHHVQWKDLKNTRVPLPNDPTVKITGFDNIMVTTVSEDKGNPHNEPAKVLDCRLHPNGTYFLLVSWWFERRSLSKSLVGFKRYLDRKWPADAPYKFILGCHFDVITNAAIMEKLPEDERFCKSMVYGGMHHNCEIFSDVPDEMERREFIKRGGTGEARLEEERQQKALFRLLFPPPSKQSLGGQL